MFSLIKTFARFIFLLIPPLILGAAIYFFGSPAHFLQQLGGKMAAWMLWTGVVVWALLFLKLFKDEPDTIDALGRIFWLGVLGFVLWHTWKGYKAKNNENPSAQAAVNQVKSVVKQRTMARPPGRM